MQMIIRLYGAHYALYPFYVSTCDVGHAGVARNRVYILLAHKERLKMLVSPYVVHKRIVATIRQAVQTQPQDYVFAQPHEILLDAGATAFTRGKKMTASWQRSLAMCPSKRSRQFVRDSLICR